MTPELTSSSRGKKAARLVSPNLPDDPVVQSAPGVGGGDYRNRSRINRIAERAHEIYQRRGGEHGRALEDWLEAEREIGSEN